MSSLRSRLQALGMTEATLAEPRPVAVQFVRDAGRETIVMFALAEVDGEILRTR